MSTLPVEQLFAALSDPTRRQIVEALAEGDALRLSDLAEQFASSRQAVTKHINVLCDAGLVATERRGRERLSRLSDDAFGPLNAWLKRYDQFWDKHLAQLKDMIEKES